MLVKLAFRNIKRSFRDFTVYFVTLALAIACFYAFNSVSSQEVFFEIANSGMSIWELLDYCISFVSVFIVFVLGALVLYATNYLIKRRKIEFGTYLLLGMKASHVSFVIAVETLICGLLALCAGLVIGIFISQGMAFLSAVILDVSMKQYEFVISSKTVVYTCIAFLLIFVIVGVFSIVKIRRTKLVNLLATSNTRNRKILSKPVSIVIFLFAIAILVFAYYELIESGLVTFNDEFEIATLAMLVGSFLFFVSVSSFVLYVSKANKKFYFQKINFFNLRQVTSRVSSACISMWVICILLFFGITVFTNGMGIAKIYSFDVKETSQFDVTLRYYLSTNESATVDKYKEISDGFYTELSDLIGNASTLELISVPMTYGDAVTQIAEGTQFDFASQIFDYPVNVVSLSEFNALRDVSSREPISLNKGEYAVVNSYDEFESLADFLSDSDVPLNLGDIAISSSHQNIWQSIGNFGTGDMMLFVVPDEVAKKLLAEGAPLSDCIINAQYKDGIDVNEGNSLVFEYLDRFSQSNNSEESLSDSSSNSTTGYASAITRGDAICAMLGVKLLCVYLALYIGLVLLISVATILAIQQLCETLDSTNRYKTLCEMGCDEKTINQSILIQSVLSFASPLILAAAHCSCVYYVLYENLYKAIGVRTLVPIILSALFVAVVYFVYMAITYSTSKSVIKQSVGRTLIS